MPDEPGPTYGTGSPAYDSTPSDVPLQRFGDRSVIYADPRFRPRREALPRANLTGSSPP